MIHCNMDRIRLLLFLLKQAFMCTAFFLFMFSCVFVFITAIFYPVLTCKYKCHYLL